MTKEQASLQFNGITWKPFQLGENTLLIRSPATTSIEEIQESANLVKKVMGSELIDIVPAYDSIAIFSGMETSQLLGKLASSKVSTDHSSKKLKQKELPICYELGSDLADVAGQVGISQQELINVHVKGTYKAVLIGFTPGFIYLDGLDERLACPRKSTPRKRLEAGSVAIGGSQTGIYGLASPGGWNIIGRTPLQLFDKLKQPPMDIEVGQQITFSRINKETFDSWES